MGQDQIVWMSVTHCDGGKKRRMGLGVTWCRQGKRRDARSSRPFIKSRNLRGILLFLFPHNRLLRPLFRPLVFDP